MSSTGLSYVNAESFMAPSSPNRSSSEPGVRSPELRKNRLRRYLREAN
jgi:hypothetical protein